MTCALGPYNFEFMTAVHREIMTRYRVDGIFINRWAGSGMCYCEHCRANFRAATGHELPRTDDPQDPARRAYIVWQQERLFELWRLWDAEVRKINPDSCVIPNAGGGATSPLDMKAIGELAPTLFADRQARSGLMPPWANGKSAKEYRADDGQQAGRRHLQRGRRGGVPLEGLGAERGGDPHLGRRRGRQRPAALVHQVLRRCSTTAAGSASSRTSTAGTTASSGTSGTRRRSPGWAWSTRSRPPGSTAARRRGTKVEDHALGWYQALDRGPDPVRDGPRPAPRRGPPGRFKTLILPNIAALSDEQCRQLRAFVERGGGLVATYETSLYDERGERRADFGLADLFGVSFRGSADGPMRNAYLRLEADPRTGRRHPLLAGLDDAPRVIHGTWRLEVTPRAAFADPPLTLIPSYPDLPMEMVYPRASRRPTSPRSTCARSAPGRVVYFPWDIDRVFWEVLAVDHGLLLAQRRAVGDRRGAAGAGQGPGVLDVTAWRQEASLTVHLVNLTNPMMMKGPFRELIPVGEQRVGPAPRGPEGPAGPAPGGGARGAGRAGRHAPERHGAVGPGPRGRGDRSLTGEARSRFCLLRGDRAARSQGGRQAG